MGKKTVTTLAPGRLQEERVQESEFRIQNYSDS